MSAKGVILNLALQISFFERIEKITAHV